MNRALLLAWATLVSFGVAFPGEVPSRFVRHDIADYSKGYQVAVVDLNRDGRKDVIALSTEADRIDAFESRPGEGGIPRWVSRPIARTMRNIDLAPLDVDGDGLPEIAVAAGFHFAEGDRGGQLLLLGRPREEGGLWRSREIAVDPVVHRLRWGDLDGDGRKELVHAPIFGPGSKGPRMCEPSHLWAFRPPARPFEDPWERWTIDESLTVLHGIDVRDLDDDGRDELLTASFEGIHRLDYEGPYDGSAGEGRWRRVRISAGTDPADDRPGSARGASEAVSGTLRDGGRFIAAIEPWHGHQVVLYTPGGDAGDEDADWSRRLLDDSLVEGHALVVADLDADGDDEIVAGWRGGGGGLCLYDLEGPRGERATRLELDRGIAVEAAVVADINDDARLDIIAMAGRTSDLAWYENVWAKNVRPGGPADLRIRSD